MVRVIKEVPENGIIRITIIKKIIVEVFVGNNISSNLVKR